MGCCKAKANAQMKQDSISGHSLHLLTAACLFSSRSLKLKDDLGADVGLYLV